MSDLLYVAEEEMSARTKAIIDAVIGAAILLFAAVTTGAVQ